MLLPSLFAFSLGIFAEPNKIAANVVKALVRDPGPPLEFSIQVRTKATKEGEWTYLAPDSFEVFPDYLRTSPQGRKITIRLPSALQRYAQVCALHVPVADPGKRFQVLLSLQSCQNVPRAEAAASPKP